MGARTTFTAEQISAIAKKLAAIPAKQKVEKEFNKTEAVSALKKEIASLQKRGYSLEEVAVMLSENSLAITTGTLKSSLSRSADSTKVAKKKPADSMISQNVLPIPPAGKTFGEELFPDFQAA